MEAILDVNSDDQPHHYGSEVMVPPMNFAIVVPGVYRSGFPNGKNLPFLRKLGLKSIIILCPDEPCLEMERFIQDSGIRKFHYKLAANKEPFVEMEIPAISSALQTVLDKRNLPCLIHCNKGTLRTGCLIGIIRKLQRWCLASIFDEFSRFSQSKERPMDQEFIELFDVSQLVFDEECMPEWVYS